MPRTARSSRLRPWRLTAADYRHADHRDGVAAAPADLAVLAALAPIFPDLTAAIQETGRWAYQEAITSLLLEDLLR